MKARLPFAIAATSLVLVALAGHYAAQPGESRNLFETAGTKQTNKDFKPAPDRIETNFGTLEFELEAFPTEETAQKLYDELDLQRATQANMDFLPALAAPAGNPASPS